MHCEAPVDEAPTQEEIDACRGIVEAMPPDLIEQFRQLIDQSKTAEEFTDRIMVGDCPKCGSSETGNCEKDPEIDDLLVGRCYECGQLFCTECLALLDAKKPHCDCLDDDASFDEDFDE